MLYAMRLPITRIGAPLLDRIPNKDVEQVSCDVKPRINFPSREQLGSVAELEAMGHETLVS
jgi:hypothetical protein